MAELKAGDRLRCQRCGTEVIVVRAPSAPIRCCGQELVARAPEGVGGG
ncbi:MAG TPA: hypothetical protein VKY15_02590 [Acidimicrobiales bacterium]|nr:hypothetical protein [Acidimicrobiales bacterium]